MKKFMFAVIMLFLCMEMIESIERHNPLFTTDKDCFTNITLNVVPDLNKPPLNEDDELINYFETPGFKDGSGYQNSKKCGWLFTSKNGTGFITLTFEYLDLEDSKECTKYDYLKVYRQGHGQNIWEELTQTYGLCGLQRNVKVEAFAEKVFIEFVSDNSRNGAGFNLTYALQFPPGPPKITCLGKSGDKTCNHVVEAKERGGVAFFCETEANPTAGVEWMRRDEVTNILSPVRSEAIENRTDTGYLQLKDLQLNDAGMYLCIAKNKHRLVTEAMELIVIEQCRCPEKIKLAWYNYPPYTQYVHSFDKYQNPIFKGILYTILDKMLEEVCKTCEKGAYNKSEIIWGSVDNRQKDLADVKGQIDTENFDIVLPILSLKDSSIYRDNFFLPIVEAPGVAYLIPKVESGGAAIFGAIGSVLPVLGITVVLLTLAGVVIWILETYWNEEEFPRTFLQGIIEGAWWAYITMTTVGYGDIAPRGVLGRIFGVIWIMGGLVIISILTGAISTALTIASITEVENLYNAKLGAINNTEEFKFGVSKAARMTGNNFIHRTPVERKPIGIESKNTAYPSFKNMLTAIEKADIEGCLVDQYVVGYHTELHILQKNSILEQTDYHYGVVFGKRIADPFVLQLFEKWVEENQFTIELAIAANKGSVPDVPEFNLMDPKSTMYITAMLSLLGMLLIFSLAGLAFEHVYLQPKNQRIMDAKNLDMLESREVKEMSKTSQKMKENLLHEMEFFFTALNERVDNLNEKHGFDRNYYEEREEFQNENEMELQKKAISEASLPRKNRPSSSTAFANEEGSSPGLSNCSPEPLTEVESSA